jgi:hypothetical protein
MKFSFLPNKSGNGTISALEQMALRNLLHGALSSKNF